MFLGRDICGHGHRYTNAEVVCDKTPSRVGKHMDMDGHDWPREWDNHPNSFLWRS